jgi:DNA-binding response OmpR family regulator
MNKNDIYIIEDNEDIGYVLTYFLKDEGYNVSLFPTVADFNMAFEKSCPDLFLIDVMLPDGNGINVCTNIKADTRTGQIPVILMSAHAPAEIMSKESCANAFLNKPFDLQVLLGTIKTHLH